MAKRSYEQSCSLAHACDIIGERWSLLLIRDLLVGPRRFKDLMRSLKGMGTNLLAARLKELQAAGVIEQQVLDSGVNAYALTPRGWALEPALLALVRWGGGDRPQQDGFHHLDEWDLVALKALFKPENANDLSVCVQFKTESFSAWVSLDKQRVTMGLGENDDAEMTVGGTIKELFENPESPTELAISGSRRKLHRFVAAFRAT